MVQLRQNTLAIQQLGLNPNHSAQAYPIENGPRKYVPNVYQEQASATNNQPGSQPQSSKGSNRPIHHQYASSTPMSKPPPLPPGSQLPPRNGKPYGSAPLPSKQSSTTRSSRTNSLPSKKDMSKTTRRSSSVNPFNPFARASAPPAVAPAAGSSSAKNMLSKALSRRGSQSASTRPSTPQSAPLARKPPNSFGSALSRRGSQIGSTLRKSIPGVGSSGGKGSTRKGM